MTAKADSKGDVSLNSTLSASDLSLDVTAETINDSADWISSGDNYDETGTIDTLLFDKAF